MAVSHEFEFRIAYADTDRMGVVYYANYLTLFERGRTELMRNMGFRYRDLEDKLKVFLPVSEANCRYLHPAKYDDLIRVITRVEKMGGASIDFTYEIIDVETKTKIAEGFTRHPFVNEKWKPVRVPADIRSKFSPVN